MSLDLNTFQQILNLDSSNNILQLNRDLYINLRDVKCQAKCGRPAISFGQYCETHTCHQENCLNYSPSNSQACSEHKCKFCEYLVDDSEKYCHTHINPLSIDNPPAFNPQKCRHVIPQWSTPENPFQCQHYPLGGSDYCLMHTCGVDNCVNSRESCPKHICCVKGCTEEVIKQNNSKEKYCWKHKCPFEDCHELINGCEKHECKRFRFCDQTRVPGSDYCPQHKCVGPKCMLERRECHEHPCNLYGPRPCYKLKLLGKKYCSDHACPEQTCSNSSKCSIHACKSCSNLKLTGGDYCEEHTCINCFNQGIHEVWENRHWINYCQDHYPCCLHFKGKRCYNLKDSDFDYCKDHKCEISYCSSHRSYKNKRMLKVCGEHQ